MLIYTPKDPAALKERLAKMPKCSTKLKALDAIKNGSGKRVTRPGLVKTFYGEDRTRDDR